MEALHAVELGIRLWTIRPVKPHKDMIMLTLHSNIPDELFVFSGLSSCQDGVANLYSSRTFYMHSRKHSNV